MKPTRNILAFLVVAVFAFGFFSATPSAYATLHTKSKATPVKKTSQTKRGASSSSSLSQPKQITAIDKGQDARHNSAPELLFVKRIVDGDTIELENGEKVRYIGMDTPESVDPRKPVQCFAKEASKKNEQLVLYQRVKLEKDITNRDKYGRLLRYVYVNDTFVNLELVKLGYAYVYTYPPDVKYNTQLLDAEQEARTNNRGLWSACQDTQSQPGHQPVTQPQTSINVEPPPQQTRRNYEAESKQNDSPPPSVACDIKGNINNKKERIYHVPGCASYNQTKIDTSRGERYFCSEQEALAAGWRKALNCPS